MVDMTTGWGEASRRPVMFPFMFIDVFRDKDVFGCILVCANVSYAGPMIQQETNLFFVDCDAKTAEVRGWNIPCLYLMRSAQLLFNL